MKYLKKDSAKANHLRERFNAALERNDKLETVYANPSYYKKSAWLRIMRQSWTASGCSPVVISHSIQSFTAGFYFPDPETGVLNVVIITPRHEYCFEW